MGAYEDSTGAAWRTRRASGWRRPARSTGSGRPRGRSTTRRRRSTAGSRTASSTPATTRSTATPTAAAPTRSALIHDSPVTGEVRAFTYGELRDRVRPRRGRHAAPGRGAGGHGRDLHAHGAGGGRGHARLRPHRRRALGRLRRLRAARAGGAHRRRAAGADRHRLLRHRGAAGGRVHAAAERRARDRRAPARRGASSCSGRRAPPSWRRGATWSGARPWRAPSRRPACRWRPPTRSTSSTPRGRPRRRRASCATTAATRWRCAGRWRTSSPPGPGQAFWAASDIGWVVGHSYIVYGPLIAGCTTILYEGKPVGTPDAGAFWRVIAEHGVNALFTAPTAFRAIKKEDPDGKLLAGHDMSRLPLPVPGGRAPRPGHLPLGQRPARHPGDRPLVADRDRLAGRRQLHGPRAAAGEAGLADQAGPGLRRARSSTSPAPRPRPPAPTAPS